MTSYQKRKREIAYLRQRIRELSQKAEFFQSAIYEAKKLVGELQNSRNPFLSLDGDEDRVIISDKDGLLQIIKDLPLIWIHPGINGDDFLTPENSPMLDQLIL